MSTNLTAVMSLINSKVPEQRDRGLALLERNEFSVPSPKVRRVRRKRCRLLLLTAPLLSRAQELDSILSALTHHRTAGSVLVRQNVLRPLPALLHKCGSALRSSLDQVVPHLAERLVDNDMGVRTLAARALLELLTVVRASVVVPAMLSKAVLGRSVRVREAVLLLLTHALHQRDPPPGMELPTACIKELPTILRLLDDAASLPAQAALALLQEVHATGITMFREQLTAAAAPVDVPRGAMRLVLARLDEHDRGVAPYLPPLHVAYPPPPPPPAPPQPPPSRGGRGGSSENSGLATPRYAPHGAPSTLSAPSTPLPSRQSLPGGGGGTLSQTMAAALAATVDAAQPYAAPGAVLGAHHPFHPHALSAPPPVPAESAELPPLGTLHMGGVGLSPAAGWGDWDARDDAREDATGRHSCRRRRCGGGAQASDGARHRRA